MGKYNTNTLDNSNSIPIKSTNSVFKRKGGKNFIEGRKSCNDNKGDRFHKEWQTLKNSADVVKHVDLALEGEKIQTLGEGTSFNNSKYRDLYQENEQHGEQVIKISFVCLINIQYLPIIQGVRVPFFTF